MAQFVYKAREADGEQRRAFLTAARRASVGPSGWTGQLPGVICAVPPAAAAASEAAWGRSPVGPERSSAQQRAPAASTHGTRCFPDDNSPVSNTAQAGDERQQLPPRRIFHLSRRVSRTPAASLKMSTARAQPSLDAQDGTC